MRSSAIGEKLAMCRRSKLSKPSEKCSLNFSSGSSITPYAGIGVSAFYLSAGSANTTGISGKVFGGVEFSSSWLLEIHYAPRTDYHGVDLSGYGVDVGYRF